MLAFRGSLALLICHAILLGEEPAAKKTIIEGVNIVDVTAGGFAEKQRVIIDGERIEMIEPITKPRNPGDAVVVDGRGMFLLPGLFDAHVHYVSPDQYGPMMIAHGVTFVRDMGGDTETILTLRDELNRGAVLGPEMIATGAIIDGKPPIWPFSEPVETPEEARAAVRKLAERGVNQIKVYSKLPRDAYLAAIDEAHSLKLKAVGHIPLTANLDDAITAGQDTVEHLEGFDVLITQCAGHEVPFPRDYRQGFSRWQHYGEADKEKLAGAYRRMREAKMAICPTMVVMQSIGKVGGEGESDPMLDTAPAFMRVMWKQPMYQHMAPGAKAVVPLMQKVVRELHGAGVTLLVGSDLANPFVIAGRSVHEEMALFQDAGVPTGDVLRAATINPAKVFGVDHRLGSIGKGKTASMFLLRKNPLEDVRHAAEIEAVFLRGKYFDRPALDDLIKQAKGSGSDAPAVTEKPGEDVVLTLPGEVLHRGRYRVKFMDMDAGFEDFLVTKTGDGYAMKVYSKPSGGPQKPSIGTFILDKDYKLREATWKPIGQPLEAKYRLDGKAIVAVAKEEGKEPQEQRMDLPEAWSFSSPYTAFEFVSNASMPLELNENKSYKSIGFGFPSWQLVVNDANTQRLEDREVKLSNGKEVKARYYTTELTLPMGVFDIQSWTEDSGLVLKYVLKMPFGTVTVELE